MKQTILSFSLGVMYGDPKPYPAMSFIDYVSTEAPVIFPLLKHR